MSTIRSTAVRGALPRLAVGAVVCFAVAVAARPAAAATVSWLGTTGTLWSGANWSAAPSTTGADALLWGGNNFSNPNSYNDIVSGTFQNLRFVGLSQSVTLSGQAIALNNSGGNTMLVTSTGGATKVVTLNLGITLTAANQLIAGPGTKIVVNGTLAGPQNVGASGTVELNAANSFTGAMRIGSSDTAYPAAAEVFINSLANTGVNQSMGAGTGAVVFGYAQPGNLYYTGAANASTNRPFQLAVNTTGSFGGSFNNNGVGTVTWSGAQTTIAGTNALTFALGGTNAGDNAWQSVIKNNTGVGGIISFTKKDAGKWILSGANTYSGSTSITGGTLEIASAGSINSTSGITLNGSGAEFKYNSATALTQPLTLTQGTLSGTGSINTGVLIGTNVTLSPGNSPGTQTYSSGTWASGGTYKWEVNNWVSGTAGTNFDQAIYTNGLAITSSTASPFTIAITSLTGSNTAGAVPSFNSGLTGQSYVIATGTMTGYDPKVFTLGTSGFFAANTVSGSANGGFWLSTNSGSTNLILNYAPSALYTLSATSSASAIYAGGSVTITGSIASSSADRTGADAMLFSNFSVGQGTLSVTSGTLVSGSGTAGTVNFSTNTAGLYTFTPTVSATNVNLGTAAVAGTLTSGTVTVWNPAGVNAITAPAIANVRVGGTFASVGLTITNTSTPGTYTEVLNATGTANGFATTSGAVSALAGGSTSTSLAVGLGGSSNTSTAGVKSGTATVSFTSTGGPGTASITSQNVVVSGTVFNMAAASSIATPVNLGNVYVGGTFGTSTLAISNTAPSGAFTEGLNASFGGKSSVVSNNSGSVSNLLVSAGTSTAMSVGLGGSTNTGAAGVVSGTQVIDFASSGINSGLSDASLESQTLTISGTVWNPAAANSITSPVSLGNIHVGGTFGTSPLSIQNTAAVSSYTEVLGASAVTSGLATSSGVVSALAGGGTSTSLSVGLGGAANTGSAGVKTGTATVSFTSTGGPGTASIAQQLVAVTGTVWNYAAASIASGTTINFGAVLKNTPLSQSLSITNSAPTGFTEKLDAVFGSPTGLVSGSGSFGLLAAGGTSQAMSVYLSSASTGTATGSVSVNFTSNGAGTSGLGTTSLGSQAVYLTGTILDPALASFTSGSTTSAILLDFGSVQQNASVSPLGFDFLNLMQTNGYTADLALYSIVGTGDVGVLTTTATSTFNTLAPGTFSPYSVSFADTSTPGSFQSIYTFQFKSSNNGSIYGGDTPQTLTLTVQGIIVVPEPGTLALAGAGLGLVCLAARKRRIGSRPANG